MKEKKIITCASYGGTGSSAITDLLKEFDIINSIGDYEFAIAHEVDGISDLQHSLVDDWHRLKNDEAIYRFIKLSKRYSKSCNKIFNNKFNEITNKYINSLVNFTWDGYWHQHEERYSKFEYLLYYKIPKSISFKLNTLKSRIISKLTKPSHVYEYTPYVRREKMYFSYVADDFFSLTKEYFRNLFNELDPQDKYEYLAIDQLVPPTNTGRYINYFDDIKIIVVDRDPRDLYILNKKFWKEGWIPTQDIKLYINWFRLMREHKKSECINNEKVLFIKFEDLVFDYENELEKIKKFLQIKNESHIYKKKYFNPEKSINNTRLWIKYNEFNDDINLIEKELKEFCYNTDKTGEKLK